MLPRGTMRLTTGDGVFTFTGDVDETRAPAGLDELTMTGDDTHLSGGHGRLTAEVAGRDDIIGPGAEGSSVRVAGNRRRSRAARAATA